jgi:hypothetical protein
MKTNSIHYGDIGFYTIAMHYGTITFKNFKIILINNGGEFSESCRVIKTLF